jgi:hypothetical protein
MLPMFVCPRQEISLRQVNPLYVSDQRLLQTMGVQVVLDVEVDGDTNLHQAAPFARDRAADRWARCTVL